MSQALLYTSAPQGLRQGASGYCTVGSTPGMEPNLAEFLEGFSGYPHPFKPPDPRTSDNPINYSFIQWSIGGQRHYVLSRICDSGLDYTGRTNLLAQHIVLTRREVDACPGGPAWVMSKDGFFIHQWNRELLTLTGPKPQTTDSPQGPCTHWQEAAGDAGYAGILAEAVLEKGGRPVNVIFPAKRLVLPLVVEAQRLLPPDRRWNVTFSTFYSRIYSSFDVQWRFFFDETTDARHARRDSQALVIDLCKKPLPEAKGGELVAAARGEGLRTATKSVVPARPLNLAPEPVRLAARTPQRLAPAEPADLRLRPPSGAEAETLPMVMPVEPLNPFQRSRRQSVILHYSIAGIGAMVLTLVIAALLVIPILRGRFQPPATAEAGLPSEQIQPTPRFKRRGEPVPESFARPGEISTPSENVNAGAASPVSNGRTAEADATPVSLPAASLPVTVPDVPAPIVASPSPEPVGPSPLQALRPKRLLELPRRVNDITRRQGTPEFDRLARITLAYPNDCELELVGKAEAFGSIESHIEMKSATEGDAKIWRVVMTPYIQNDKEQLIGTFRLAADHLRFQWNKNVSSEAKPDSLPRCLLRINVSGDSELFRLSKPEPIENIELSKLGPGLHSIQVPSLDGKTFGGIDALRLEARLVGVPADVSSNHPGAIETGQSQQLWIKGGNSKAGYAVLGFKIEFKRDPDSDKRRIEIFAKPAYKKADDGSSDFDAVVNSTHAFNPKEMGAKNRTEQGRISNLETQINAKKNLLKTARRANDPTVKLESEEVRKFRQKVHEAPPGEKGLLKLQLEMHEKKLDEAAEKLRLAQKEVDDIQDTQGPIKADVTAYEAMLKLISSVQEPAGRSTLEFRIYMERPDQDKENQIIELYRSKGFPSK